VLVGRDINLQRPFGRLKPVAPKKGGAGEKRFKEFMQNDRSRSKDLKPLKKKGEIMRTGRPDKPS